MKLHEVVEKTGLQPADVLGMLYAEKAARDSAKMLSQDEMDEVKGITKDLMNDDSIVDKILKKMELGEKS